MEPIRILVVEDELRLAQVLKRQLEDAGFQTDVVNDGYLGKQYAQKKSYQLILLDINLPLINGYDLSKEIRKTDSAVPILMLTAFGSPENKLTGFDSGADDYIVKPYDSRELLARINVFLRRSENIPKQEKLYIADVELNISTKSVLRSGRKIDLTSKEYALFETLVRNKDTLLSRETITEQVWGMDFDPGTNIIDVYIKYLRKKIDKDFEPKLIHTRFGFGFYCSDKEI
jgi:two-component system, OmpR family, copper resistance phosphate regulon response regulator CusR